ncbi:OLC1v1038958C1 [Oldenlandia corymbosa var. corymbosa]|uniref:OLC1v1038958C1 n=1 Tax=Oldenlandia corymbosa var. corymbosa TaxID=529605 RepID=A0AAV1D177_OLDCO|nr:OLC1v1038958C1 [Oldenlandia corymbosa var. corymbosa]
MNAGVFLAPNIIAISMLCTVERRASCPLLDRNEIKRPTDFNFCIFLKALQSQVVVKGDFSPKLFNLPLWWGWRNLSSLGQNLQTSKDIVKNFFARLISVAGFALFALLISRSLVESDRQFNGLNAMELTTWALDPKYSTRLPTSVKPMKAIDDVEAFALRAHDLRFIASQFPCLNHKQAQHIFRAMGQLAVYNQLGNRYHRKKLEKSLQEEEERLQVALHQQAGGGSPTLILLPPFMHPNSRSVCYVNFVAIINQYCIRSRKNLILQQSSQGRVCCNFSVMKMNLYY